MVNQSDNAHSFTKILSGAALCVFISVLGGILLLGHVEPKDYIAVAVVTLSLFIGVQSQAVIPYLVFSLAYLLLFFLGQLLIGAELIDLRFYQAELSSTATLEFSIYFLAASLGFVIFDKLAPHQVAEDIPLPDFSTGFIGLVWGLTLALMLFLKDLSHPAVTILTKVVLPVFGFALLWKLKNKALGIAIMLLTVLPVISSRHTTGQFIAWGVVMYFIFVPYAEVSLKKFIKLISILFVVSASAFFAGTAVKYDLEKVFNIQHYITRVLLVHSHSTAKLVEIGNQDPDGAAQLYGGGKKYWLSLIPGIDKPVNAGDVTYKLSRETVTKTDLPYLPPGAPGELYITLGMLGMIIGGILHGCLISMLWYTASRLKSSPVYSSLFTGATIFLCGIGTASFYARINAVKEALYVLVILGIATYIITKITRLRRITGDNKTELI